MDPNETNDEEQKKGRIMVSKSEEILKATKGQASKNVDKDRKGKEKKSNRLKANLTDDDGNDLKTFQEQFDHFRHKLIKNKKEFKDPDFSADIYSLTMDFKNKRFIDMTWKRAGVKSLAKENTTQDFYGLKNSPIIAGGIYLTNDKTATLNVMPKLHAETTEINPGIFRLKLWKFGHWQDIIIDDLLPMEKNEFAYLNCKPASMWLALLEKAYAKTFYCYEDMYETINDQGKALQSFTGGIVESFTLKSLTDDESTKLFDTLSKMTETSFIFASIDKSNLKPSEFADGNVYPIIGAFTSKDRKNYVAMRNHFKADWKLGKNPPTDAPKTLPKNENWLDFEFVLNNMSKIGILHLPNDEQKSSVFKGKVYNFATHGSWVVGFNDGGVRGSPKYFKNPQYGLEISGGNDKQKLIVSLEVKTNEKFEFSFTVYKTNEKKFQTTPKQKDFLADKKNYLSEAAPSTKTNQVVLSLDVKPGIYVIVPHIKTPGAEGTYLLRVFTEFYECKFIELKNEIKITPEKFPERTLLPGQRKENMTLEDYELQSLNISFFKCALTDMECDAYDLQYILMKGFNSKLSPDVFQAFEIDVCKSFMASKDPEQRFKIKYADFQQLAFLLIKARDHWLKVDKDKKGKVDISKLEDLLLNNGIVVTRSIAESISKRFGRIDESGKRIINFNSYMHCIIKTKSLYEKYNKLLEENKNDPEKVKDGKLKLHIDDLLKLTIYS